MALPVGSFNFNQIAEQQQKLHDQQQRTALGVQTGKPDHVEPGTLYIADNFISSGFDTQAPHGLEVRAAAQSTGFKGPIQLREFPSARYVSYDPNQPEPGQDPRASDYLRSLQWKTQERYQQALRPSADQLNELSAGGVKNSAVNFSMGTDRGRVVEEAYVDLLEGRADRTGAAKAFGLDESKLANPDLKISGPERARLQQALIHEVDRTASTSPSIKAAKKEYDTAVSRFEAGHNSVVVAGGNEGEVLDRLKHDSGGRDLKIPASFYDSPLVNDQVVVVGATEGDPSRKPAAYSMPHRQNQIYASGTVPNDPARGSSFASPRVAATMAQLHRLHPEMNSKQVESLMVGQLSQPAEGANASVLDLNATRQFLETNKF